MRRGHPRRARSPRSAPISIRPVPRKTIDVTGLYVTPGLVDIHTHLFHTTGTARRLGRRQQRRSPTLQLPHGVTTMVDAGSAGWRDLRDFRHTVIDRAQTRVLAFINIAGLGMMTDAAEQETSDFKPEEVARLARKHRDVVVGVKSRALSEAGLAVRGSRGGSGQAGRHSRDGGFRLVPAGASLLATGDASTCGRATSARTCSAAPCPMWTTTASCSTICARRAPAA